MAGKVWDLSTLGRAALNAEITRQAAIVAYIDDYWMMSLLALAAMPLVLLLGARPMRARAGTRWRWPWANGEMFCRHFFGRNA